jgi:perosamine synthetase
VKQNLSILGGSPIRTKKFKHPSIISSKEKNAVIRLLDTKKLSGFYQNFLGGEKVIEFEKKWAKFFKCKYAVAVNSGTSAQHAALIACGVKRGDEVIVTSLSFTSTLSTILMCNATPVFCDICPDTFNIDVEEIKKKITKKTKVIVPVHLYGFPANIKEILEIAKKYSLKVIEDTCQSPGSKYKGKFLGTIGDLGTFSTVETKNITTGEGGIIVGNNLDLIHKCRLVRNHGESYKINEKRYYTPSILGYNFRPTEFQATIGIEQLKRLNKINKTRRKLTDYLLKNLQGLKGITLPLQKNKYCKVVPHLICLQYDEKLTGVKKNIYMKALEKEGLPVTGGYQLSLYQIYNAFRNRSYKKKLKHFPVVEKVIKNSIWLNQARPPATINDMKDIIKIFKKIDKNIHKLKNL